MANLSELQKHKEELSARVLRSKKKAKATRLFLYDDCKIVAYDKSGCCQNWLNDYLEEDDELDITIVEDIAELEDCGATVSVHFVDHLDATEKRALKTLTKEKNTIIVNINGCSLPKYVKQHALRIIEHPDCVSDLLAEIVDYLESR